MMIEKITGIVIDTVKHSDRHNVVSLFTRSRGRVATLSPATPGSARRKGRQARLMPLSVIETDMNFRPDRELQTLGAVTLGRVWHNLYFDPAKSALVFFISEFLNRLLRNAPPDPVMFDYIVECLAVLDGATQRVADFHLHLLAGLLHYNGISPDAGSYRPGAWLDMRAGRYDTLRPPHSDSADPDTAAFIHLLCSDSEINSLSSFSSLSSSLLPALNREQRTEILNALLRYYETHLPGTSRLRSLPILHDLFS